MIAVFQRHRQTVIVFLDLDAQDAGMGLNLLPGRLRHAVADRHVHDQVLSHLPDGRLHITIEQ